MRKHTLTLFLLPAVLFFAACNSHSDTFQLNYSDVGGDDKIGQDDKPKDQEENGAAGDKEEPPKQKTYKPEKNCKKRPDIRKVRIEGILRGGDDDSKEAPNPEEDTDE